MSSRFRSGLRMAAVAVAMAAMTAAATGAPLRVCGDPNDLPFSNKAGQGLDNRVALVLGRDLGRPVQFIWARSRRGFLREQFNKGACDLLMGVPAGMKGVLTSNPYYRSSYVFVTPAGEHMRITAFSDPRLNGRRIGLQVLEDDFSPPSLPLIRYGHAGQLVGFDSFTQADEIVRAVANGKVGAAVVWGPIAGYYAARLRLPVVLSPVSPGVDPATHTPFWFAVSAAVHRGDKTLLDQVNAAIAKHRTEIEHILVTYHVPETAPDAASRDTAAVVTGSGKRSDAKAEGGAL